MAACLPSTYTVETELASVSQSYLACRDGAGLRLPVVPSACGAVCQNAFPAPVCLVPSRPSARNR